MTKKSDIEKSDISENNSSKNKIKPKRYRAPLYIAGGILTASVLFFGGWKCFFDTSIYGTWGVSIQNSDGSGSTQYTITLDENMGARLHNSGSAIIGRYRTMTDSTGRPEINLIMSNFGDAYVDVVFDYQVAGNIFTGRKLLLTDRSYMLTTLEKEGEKHDTVNIAGDDYNIYEFSPSEENYKIVRYDDFKADEKLLGSWLYIDEDYGYRYTFTFSEDGTFEQLSTERDIKGGYKIENGVCTLHYYYLGNEEYELPVEYKAEGENLTFSGMSFTKADDKYAYEQAIK